MSGGRSLRVLLGGFGRYMPQGTRPADGSRLLSFLVRKKGLKFEVGSAGIQPYKHITLCSFEWHVVDVVIKFSC